MTEPPTFEETFNSLSKAVFQSFFHSVGDIEDITEAVKKYVETPNTATTFVY